MLSAEGVKRILLACVETNSENEVINERGK